MEKLKILYLEDDPTDYELVLLEIKKGGFHFESIQVLTKDDFFSKINSFQPNLILSDYSLPLYNGLDAIRDCRKNNIDLPIIIVSGRVNHEIAIECLRSGADDYVLKDQLSTIVNAIRNIIRIYEEKSFKKEAMLNLCESEEKYRTVFQNNRAMMIIYDPLTEMIFDANLAAINFYGYPLEMIQRMKIQDLVCRESFSIDSINEMIHPLTCSEIEHKLNDGSLRTMESCGSSITINNKNYILLVSIDVSRRKQAEQKLKDNQLRLSEIIDYSPIGKAIFTNQGKLITANKSFKQIFSFPENSELKNFYLFDQKFLSKENHHALQKNNFIDFELNITLDLLENLFQVPITRLGSFYVKIFIKRIPINTLFEEKEYLMQVIDISKQKLMDKMRTEFISNISHEIRTPLTSIKESVIILKDHFIGNLTKDQEYLVTTAHRNVIRLEKLVTDILDFQKMDMDFLTLQCQFYQANDLVKQVYNDFQTLIQNSHLETKFELDNTLPSLYFDKDKIRQVLYNLLSNAIKFTEKGSITLRTKFDKEYGIIQVVDTGVGIIEEDLAKIFEPFFQSPVYQNNRDISNGLGLAISKKIVDAHYGKLVVSSQRSFGSTFSIYLPIETHHSTY